MFFAVVTGAESRSEAERASQARHGGMAMDARGGGREATESQMRALLGSSFDSCLQLHQDRALIKGLCRGPTNLREPNAAGLLILLSPGSREPGCSSCAASCGRARCALRGLI